MCLLAEKSKCFYNWGNYWSLESSDIALMVGDADQRHLPAELHAVGKRKTQRIEQKHLRLRTRIKRLARKTICFSQTEVMHDLVIGLFVNRYQFGLPF